MRKMEKEKNLLIGYSKISKYLTSQILFNKVIFLLHKNKFTESSRILYNHVNLEKKNLIILFTDWTFFIC